MQPPGNLPEESVARGIGTMIGVIASMILVAPETTMAAVSRFFIGVTMGFVFAPTLHHVWGFSWLAGDEIEFTLARGAAAGFLVWFVLEATARFMSKSNWLERVLEVVLRAKGKK